MPFSATTLNFAGKPSRVGGLAAKILGALVLTFGLSIALGLGLLAHAIFTVWVGLAIGLPIAIITLVVGLGLVLGGSSLARSGSQAARGAKLDALRALANHQRGVVTPVEAAASLGVSQPEADRLLTELATMPDEDVSLDVDDNGNLLYLFGRDATLRRIEWSRERFEVPQEAGGRYADGPPPQAWYEHENEALKRRL
jgi:hypothetical protein